MDWRKKSNQNGIYEHSEIEEKLVDWNYRSILRDTAYYSDKLIKVSGTVLEYEFREPDIHMVALRVNDIDDEVFIVGTLKKYLEDDKLEVIGVVNPELLPTDEIPALISIREKCLNCQILNF